MIAAPRFYAQRLGAPFADQERALSERLPRPLRRLAASSGLARGLALGWLARRGIGVAVIRRERGSLPALLVCALPPKRRAIFVLELIRRPLPATAWRRALYRTWWRLVENPALRRGMAGGQVMTAWERDEYARHYRIERERLSCVPWALCDSGVRPVAEVPQKANAVFASGRTACDWPTLFAAATGSCWELVVVCSERDLARVQRLAAATRPAAQVHSELSWDENDRLLRRSAVCAIALEDRELSAGHVRLMAAVEAGVPVVASSVRSLEGYVLDGQTAVLVPVADPDRLRAAVDALLADSERRSALREAALRRARSWTYADYFARIRVLVLSSVDQLPGEDGSG